MDLNAPLGMTPLPSLRRRRVVLLVGGILVVVTLGGVALVLAWADPRGGRPYAVAELPPPAAPAPRRPTALDPTPTGTVAPPASSDAISPSAPRPSHGVRTGSLEGGVMVYRGSGNDSTPSSAAPAPLVIDVTHAIDDPLGKSHGTGVPAAKAAVAASLPAAPARVAIFVSGMGLDAGATRIAIETMPAAVTLAFLPYGTTVAASVGAAKSKGHEVLLQLPMRNEGGGSSGPHALRTGAPSEALKSDLAWLMDRFTGYDGIVNLLGAPVTADAAVMTAVLKAAGARHLYYLDDGTSLQSVGVSLAADLNVEAAKADIVLDATSDPGVVRANLDRLVAIAKRKGKAVGMASGLPEHLGSIARFAAELGSHGVVLVPVSTLAHAGDSPQAAATR